MGKVIYQPKGRAGEYAKYALNVYQGCDHECTYCYAPSVIKMAPETFHKPRPRKGDFWRNLERDSAQLSVQGTRDQVLLCFTCDPYCHLDVELQHTRQAIQLLHAHGLPVCTLTKGGERALRDIDLFSPADSFATTLTCSYISDSMNWEPRAANPKARIYTLAMFHEAGVPTWVSLEPVIEPWQTLELIEKSADYVDLFKVGMLNYHPHAKSIDWHDFGWKAKELLENLGKPYLIKADLKKAMGIE